MGRGVVIGRCGGVATLNHLVCRQICSRYLACWQRNLAWGKSSLSANWSCHPSKNFPYLHPRKGVALCFRLFRQCRGGRGGSMWEFRGPVSTLYFLSMQVIKIKCKLNVAFQRLINQHIIIQHIILWSFLNISNAIKQHILRDWEQEKFRLYFPGGFRRCYAS